MYLLYVDESGSPAGNSAHFVLGGVAVFERQTYYLSQKLDNIQEQFFPGEGGVLKLHASALWGGREEPWSSLDYNRRQQLTHSILDCLAEANDPGVVLFAVSIRKSDFPNGDPVEKTLEQLILRFDQFLSRRYYTGDNQRGLMIFAESHYRERIETLMAEFTKAGTRFGRVKNYCDIPLFAPSAATRMLQLADFVTYSVFRRYETGDTRYLDRILHRFDRDVETGKMHGLTHLVARRQECYCPACLSRR